MTKSPGVIMVMLCSVLALAGWLPQLYWPVPSGAEIARCLTTSTLIVVGTPGQGWPVNKPDSDERKRAIREIEINRGGFLPLPETAGWLTELKIEQTLWAGKGPSQGSEKEAAVPPKLTQVRVFSARDPERAKFGYPVYILWKMDRRYIFFLQAIPKEGQGWVHSDPRDAGPYFQVLEEGTGMIEISAANAETVKRIYALCEALSAQGLALKLDSLRRLRSTGDTVLGEAAQALIDWLQLPDPAKPVR